jgi:polyhydroxybutyrate depolymerase
LPSRRLRLTVGGIRRSYLLTVPPSYHRTAPAPLLLVTHGLTSTAEREERTAGFDAVTAQYGVLVAYPEALALDGDVTSWNAGTCCGPAAATGVSDLRYLHALIKDVERRYAVDRERVYYVGMSNGGMLGYRLICEHADWISAVAVVSGSRVYNNCTPSRARPVLHVHGSADALVPVAGSPDVRRLDTPVLSMSMAASIAPIAKRNGCTGWTIETDARSGLETSDGIGCATHADVRMVTIRGLGHGWTRNAATFGIDETAYIWRWLSRQSRLAS